jgi:preprotein translocase subunit YajC
MTPGDRVQTKSGRLGTLQSPTVNMPVHHLVKFDDGTIRWVVKEAIEIAHEPKRRRKP